MQKNSAPPSRRFIVRRLAFFYTIALLLVGLIVLANALIRSITFEPHLTQDIQAVNLVTNQEELSQRLARDALVASSVTFGLDTAARAAFIADIPPTLAHLEENQTTLRGGDGQPGLRGVNTQDLTAQYGAIAPSYSAFVSATKDLIALLDALGSNRSPASIPRILPLVQLVVLEAQTFEDGMKTIAGRYQDDSREIQQREATLDRLLVGSTLGALVIVGLLVFRPATEQVGRSIDELARAREQQRELATLKDQFIIYANHELRTPIMGLYNSIELLDAVNQRSDDPERRARLIQRALASGKTLLILLRNVLDTSALETKSPRVDVVGVPLAPLIRTILETFDPLEIGEPALAAEFFLSRSVTINVPNDLVVLADEGRLRQVFVNLLSNALKYSPAETPITITAGIFRPARQLRLRSFSFTRTALAFNDPRATMIHVSVQDQGLGVPARDIPILFNRFVRLERDIAGPVRGTGVGLYLCRMLVEAMGGEIWVESSGISGEGSTFSFTLPKFSPRLDP